MQIRVGVANGKTNLAHSLATPSASKSSYKSEAALKEQYEKDINFVFLNVDNQKWENYVRKFDVNGIPQVNLFDRKGNLISTFIGKHEESTIRDSIGQLDKEINSYEEIFNSEFSRIKENKNLQVNPRNHG